MNDSIQEELAALQKENKELREAIGGYSHKGTMVEARSLPSEPLARLRADNNHLRRVLEAFRLNLDIELAAKRAEVASRNRKLGTNEPLPTS